MNEIKIAIVGFGGIARVHYASYEALRRSGNAIRVVAICDRDRSRIFQKVQINLGSESIPVDENVHIYSDVETLIAEEEFDMADVCLPTFLHKEMSIRLLMAGKHVLCEKPMALCSEDCLEMVNAAKESGKRLMIAQCMRYDARVLFLKQCIDEGRFGVLRYLELDRHCDFPLWGADFDNADRTGGCILDTHVHDVDMARFLLGEPKEVSTVQFVRSRCQLINSRLYYDNAVVIADVAWDEARETPFSEGFRARFDSGSVDSDGKKIRVTPHMEEGYQLMLPETDRVAEELRAFIELVRDPSLENKVNPPESAMESVRLIEKLKQSAAISGKKI